MSVQSVTYRGIKITYEIDEYLKDRPAEQYGVWTFTLDNTVWRFPTIDMCYERIDLILGEKRERDSDTKTEYEETQAKEIEDVVEVTEALVPALPWYASWLSPVMDQIVLVSDTVINVLNVVLAPIARGADAIADMPLNVTDRLTESIKNMYEKARGGGVDQAQKTINEIQGDKAPWKLDLEANLTNLFSPLIEEYFSNTNPEKYEESLVEPEKAADSLNLWRAGIVGAGLANFIIHNLTEAGTLGQMEGIASFDSLVVNKMGLQGVAQRSTMLPFEKGLLKQAEKFYNMKYQAELPEQSQLIEMVVKEVIPLDAFKEFMTQQGYNETWSQNIWDAHFIPPNWGQLLQAYYRGNISRSELEELKILVDLDPKYDIIWNSLVEVIPPYQEIINMRVKEVIDQETFEKYLQWLGYDSIWAARIWDAHFIPPSLGDMLTAWRRGEITEERLDELMIIVDLDPRFKEIFDTRKYDDPSLSLGRFMFETGSINASRVAEIVKRAGYPGNDIPSITDYIVRFQERLWRRRYIVQLQRAFEMGIRTEDELRAEVAAASYTDGVAHWIIETSNLRNEMKAAGRAKSTPKILTLGDLKKAFETDRMSEDEFRNALNFRGYDFGEVDLLVTLMTDKKVTSQAGGRKVALSQSELLNAWRYGELEEDPLRIALSLRGLALDEVDMLINVKKKQWDMIT